MHWILCYFLTFAQYRNNLVRLFNILVSICFLFLYLYR